MKDPHFVHVKISYRESEIKLQKFLTLYSSDGNNPNDDGDAGDDILSPSAPGPEELLSNPNRSSWREIVH